MANNIRKDKPANAWTANELMAYNITISSLKSSDFFPVPDLSLDHVDPSILTSPPGDINPALSDATFQYLSYLALAISNSQESFFNDFAAETLKLLGFNERYTTVSPHYIMPFCICANNKLIVKADICLLHRQGFVLLVLSEERVLYNGTNAEEKVIAEVIAAFQNNNEVRWGYSAPTLNAMSIPCIKMSGTRPTFYIVPVTTELSDAVITGQYPATPTQVLRCVTVETPFQSLGIGMEDREYITKTIAALQSFQATESSKAAKGLWPF